MKIGRLAALAAVVALAAVAINGTATAVPSGQWDAQVIGNVSIDADDPTVAYITARYVCSGVDTPHIWVSVKQAESRGPDPLLKEEGSSEYAVAWSQAHPTNGVCDGKWHVDTFKVDQTESFEPAPGVVVHVGHGQLSAGQGYVQFCVLDPTTEDGTIVWSTRYARVV